MRILLAAALLLFVPASWAQPQAPSYPAARQADTVEELFGVKVSNPYRWMEDAGSKELADWVGAQDGLARAYLRGLPLRAHFYKRITELWDYPKTSIPVFEGGRLFYRHTDGRLIAYALAEGGADWRTIRVRDIASGRELPDEVKWIRFSWLSWTRDNKGFFYSRFPEPPKGQALHAALGGQAVYYHRLGTPQSEDVLIIERPDLSRGLLAAWVPRQGRYLLIRLAEGSGPVNRLYYVDMGDPARPDVKAPVKPVVEDDGAEYTALGYAGSTLYVKTDENAPNRKIIAIDLRNPRRETWKTVIPETKDAIRIASLFTGQLVVEYLSDVQSRLALFDTAGRPQGEIALPDAGSVTGLGGQRSGRIFFEFTSPLYQPTVFQYNPQNGQVATFEAPSVPIDASKYETRRLFAVSKDGTRVPFFLTARKDLKLDGTNPTLLHGYGGFFISILPVYRPHVVSWLELGGIWVSADIRGGGED